MNYFIRNKRSEHNPRAFVLGGQPGAGKTGLQKIMSKKRSWRYTNGQRFYNVSES